MKKLMLGLVLVALAACVVMPAEAGRKNVYGNPLKWVKADGAGSTTYDSTRVSIVWSAKETTPATAACDTTVAFDLRSIKFPARTWATGTTDSTEMATLVGFHVLSFSSAGANSGTGDTTLVAVQFSYDGVSWTTMNAATGCWYLMGQASNTIIPALKYLNRTAGANYMPNFVRALVANCGPSTALVRYYEVRPVYWIDD